MLCYMLFLRFFKGEGNNNICYLTGLKIELWNQFPVYLHVNVNRAQYVFWRLWLRATQNFYTKLILNTVFTEILDRGPESIILGMISLSPIVSKDIQYCTTYTFPLKRRFLGWERCLPWPLGNLCWKETRIIRALPSIFRKGPGI